MKDRTTNTCYVPLEKIKPNPFQSKIRQSAIMDGIEPLAQAILSSGFDGVIVGRVTQDHGLSVAQSLPGIHNWEDYLHQNPDSVVEIAFGHRRTAACSWLVQNGHEEFGQIPVQIKPLDNREMAVRCWNENHARTDLTPMEQAESFSKMIDVFSWSQSELAREIGVGRSMIANKIRLRKLPERVQTALHSGLIAERAAMRLLLLYQLPLPVQRKLESYLTEYSYIHAHVADINSLETPLDIFFEMAKMSVTSDEIEKQIKNAIMHAGTALTVWASAGHIELSEIDFGDMDGIISPTCTTCPNRYQAKCYDTTQCREIKVSHQLKIIRASKQQHALEDNTANATSNGDGNSSPHQSPQATERQSAIDDYTKYHREDYYKRVLDIAKKTPLPIAELLTEHMPIGWNPFGSLEYTNTHEQFAVWIMGKLERELINFASDGIIPLLSAMSDKVDELA